MKRREFLKLTGTTLFSLSLASCQNSIHRSNRNTSAKNILFILCDDLNDSISGLCGRPYANTPNINRLMKEGVTFKNAHSNCPICAPSRASFITGIYPHTSGYYGYLQNQRPSFRQNPILQNCPTFMEMFARSGYTLYGSGKITHDGKKDMDLWRSSDGIIRYGVPTDYGPWPSDGISAEPLPYPNAPSPLNKRLWDGFAPLSDKPVFKLPDGSCIMGQWRNYTGKGQENPPFHYVNDEDRDLMADEQSALWAQKQLCSVGSHPFLMTIGFCKPHWPCYLPKRYYDHFDIDSIQLPDYLQGDLDDCASVLRNKTSPDDWGKEIFDAVMQAGARNTWKQWIRGYLANIAYVDDQIGKLLDALEKSGHKDDTFIIFTSDNGYHLGQKDHLFKNTLWDKSSRVPLVIAGPGIQKGAECRRVVSLIDLYPTMLDLCKIPAAENTIKPQGCSLLPLLENPHRTDWSGPDAALIAISGDTDPGDTPAKQRFQHFAIRTPQWKYILCSNGEQELYDCLQDQHQWNNLADKHSFEHITAALREKLLEMRNIS